MAATAEKIQGSHAMSDAEWKVRIDLAACYRLIAWHQWDDLIFTHVSARVPGTENEFLINPYGLTFDEITASSLVKIGLDGVPLAPTPYPVNPAGFTIHSAVHEIRHDAACVIHVHTPDGTAVASVEGGLQPINQASQSVCFDLAYHDYEGIALDHDERPRLQQDLGNKNLMLLRNHGTLALGRSVAEAYLRMYFLERACTMQVRTAALGKPIHPVDAAVIGKNADIIKMSEGVGIADNLVWPAMLRRLDRIDPSYKN